MVYESVYKYLKKGFWKRHRMKRKFYWDSLKPADYLFGVDYDIYDKEISFKNNLMPPSLVIHEWLSKQNYQASRSQVELPLLKKGSTYRLGYKGVVVPEDRLYLQVAFFNRMDEELSVETIKSSSGTFTYPQAAHYYAIRLVNAGLTDINFQYMYLEQLEQEETKEHSVSLFVIIQEHDEDILPLPFLNTLGNYMIVSKEKYGDFTDVTNFEAILSDVKQLKEKNNHYYTIFVGYGEYGNLIAASMKEYIPESVALISSRLTADNLETSSKELLSKILQKNSDLKNVICYGKKVESIRNPIVEGVVNAQISQIYRIPEILKERYIL